MSLVRALLFLMLLCTCVAAQTNPGFIAGKPLCADYPSAACPAPSNPLSLNQAFQLKADYPYAGPVSGVTFSGVPSIGWVPMATSSTTAAWTNLFGSANTWTASQAFGSGINVNGGMTFNNGVLTYNALSYPASDSTFGGSIATGPFALNGQTASAAYSNIAIGFQAIGGTLTTAATQNTAVGFQAMALTTAGNANAAFGAQALLNNTTGAFNSVIGDGALSANTSGSENVAIGASAMSGNTSGGFNIGIGFGCCNGVQTGSFNIWMGEAAAQANTSGAQNIGIGQGVMALNTTGSASIAIGNQALAGNTTNGAQFAVGTNALRRFTGTSGSTDIRNTATGHEALSFMTVGGYNTAFGFEAGLFLGGAAGADCTGSCTGNTALGALANTYTTAGNFNTGVGYFALLGNGRADTPTFTANYAFNNTAVGANAGLAIENGGKNTLIGMNAGKAITGVTVSVNSATPNAVGSGYGASVSGTMTWSGAGCTTNPILNVTTSGGGVIASVSSVATAGTCATVPSSSATTWTAGGALSAGTGASFNLAFIGGTDSADNTAMGFNSCSAVTTGIQNTCVGSNSNTNGTTGTGNITIGYGINVSAPTVSQELHIGYNGADTITGNLSTKSVTVQGVMNVPTTTASVGQYQINNSAFMHNGGVPSDTFVGNIAGNFSLSGASNTCIGNGTCPQLTTGTQNTTTGAGNLSACTSCSFDTSMGYNALLTVTTAAQNAAFGFNSLVQNLTGANNSGFGSASCSDITTGVNNTCIGINEGSGQTTGGGNTFVGNTTAIGATQTTTLATFNSTTAVVLGGNDTNLSLAAGMRVQSGGCIANGTTIASVSSTQNITLSQAAICGTSGQISFFSSPYQTYNTATTGVGCFTTTSASAVVNLSGTGTCTVALMGLLKGMRVTANTVTMTNGSTITAINSNTQFTISAVAGAGGAGGNATFQNPLGGTGCMTCANTVLIGRWLAGMFPNSLSGNLSGGIGFADGAGNNRADYGISAASTWTLGANTGVTGTLTVSAIAANTGAQTGYLCYNTTGGVITYDATNTCLVSSERYKEHITPFIPEDALNEAMRLVPSSFNRRSAYSADTSQRLGLIAEQVAGVDERLVVRGSDGLPRGVLYETGGVAIAIGAIQALKADNDNMRARIDILERMSR